MLEEMMESAERIYHISKEMDTFYGMLKAAQHMLRENNAHCERFGIDQVKPQAEALEETLDELLDRHAQLCGMFQERSEAYMRAMKSAVPPVVLTARECNF